MQVVCSLCCILARRFDGCVYSGVFRWLLYLWSVFCCCSTSLLCSRRSVISSRSVFFCCFFFQAEDGIRDYKVTGVQTCALPICGGAALSIYGVTKKPIKYIGVGEKSDALEEFHPDRMAGRILQMGDVVSLVEKAQAAFDEEAAKKLQKKVKKEGMDLTDFLNAMRQIERMGPLEGVLKMLPGMNSKMLKQAKVDPKRMKHVEAIVLSMTPAERKDPSLLNGSRRARVARGSGRTISEVNRLLEQFREMQKMMKKMSQGGRMGMPSMPGMFGMR